MHRHKIPMLLILLGFVELARDMHTLSASSTVRKLAALNMNTRQTIETHRQAVREALSMEQLQSIARDVIGHDEHDCATVGAYKWFLYCYLMEWEQSLPVEPLAVGDRVRFAECMSDSEADERFTVIEDRGDRVLVECINTMHIRPTMVYLKTDLVKV